MTTKQPMTRQGAYLKRMAERGHFKQKLGETSLALTECFCKADMGNRRTLGTQLLDEMHGILVEIYGWPKQDADDARATLYMAMDSARPNPKEVA